MSLISHFIAFITKEKLFSSQDHLLLAVSGGLDSVVLCELCKEAGFQFSIAHCNFRLRGAESERDKNFVQEVAKNTTLHFTCRNLIRKNTPIQKLSIQEAARELRYNWFDQLIQEGKPNTSSPRII